MGNNLGKLTRIDPSTEKSRGQEYLNHFQPCRTEIFTYNILKEATRKFSNKNLVGQGGCGDVYKGWLDYRTKESAKQGYGLAVAIKKIKKEGSQGLDEWRNELRILSSFYHPNVVQLLGFCADGVHRMLMFEFIAMGILEENLSRGCTPNGPAMTVTLLPECSRKVSWRKRMKISIGIARGLMYLHTMDRPIIHRDIKSANILLDHVG
ncbi:probable serine/threonine-protein kinase PBL3 [Rutidosis leptorrhynchoides]|uniref:probable serine/threonine-protein kinase PBL3 n=1 Tax=Rutidosis leptorrhynchoides TaxID=125765 RepID=UPI003A99BFCB